MRQRKSTSGRRETEEMEDLLGENIINPFGTRDLEIFEEKLKSMKYEDMIELARKIGINVRQPSQRIVACLKKEFILKYGTESKDYSLDEMKKTQDFAYLSGEDRDEIKDLMYFRGTGDE